MLCLQLNLSILIKYKPMPYNNTSAKNLTYAIMLSISSIPKNVSIPISENAIKMDFRQDLLGPAQSHFPLFFEA